MTTATTSSDTPIARTARTASRRAIGLGGLALAAVGASIVVAGSRAPTGGGSSLEREPLSQLTPVAGSGVTGTARVRRAPGDKGSITLTATGLRPGLTYIAQLYAGPPDAPSASSGRLGELVPDSSGRVTLTATEARFGAAGATAPLPYALLTDGERSIAIIAPSVGPVATTPLSRR